MEVEGDVGGGRGPGVDPGTPLMEGGTRGNTIPVVDMLPATLLTANGLTCLVEAPTGLTANGLRVPSFAGNWGRRAD